MPKKGKVGKERLDKYYHLAKQQGYRARSAFKLIQLNRKFGFLNSCRALIDLCAAPGGWLQVASKNMPVSSVIIGVDLVPIKPIGKCITLAEDITTQKCRSEIKKAIKTWKADVVLHDGSPNLGGAWTKDAFTQAELVLAALRLATEFLAPNGCFVSKVFRSKDYNALIYVFGKFFRKVTATKPAASRNTSAEVFVVCEGYRAPRPIDPKLLDPKQVFKDQEPDTPAPRLFAQKVKKHRAEGYDESLGQSLLSKRCSLADFIAAHDALNLLATCSEFTVTDEESKKISDNSLTTEELKEQFKDLRVLGKTEFKQILRWREAIRKKLKPVKEKVEERELTAEEKEELLVKEMESKVAEISSAEKHRLKKQLERQQKSKNRLQRVKVGSAVEVEEDTTEQLFHLSNVASSQDLDQLLDGNEAPVEELMAEKEKSEQKQLIPKVTYVSPESRDSIEEQDLDTQYEKYLERKRRGKAVHFKTADGYKTARLPAMTVDTDAIPTEEVVDVAELEEYVPLADDVDFGGVQEEVPESRKNPLIVTEPTANRTSLWFSQDCFQDIAIEPIVKKEHEEGQVEPMDTQVDPEVKKEQESEKDSKEAENDPTSKWYDSSKEGTPPPRKKRKTGSEKAAPKRVDRGADFEIVPLKEDVGKHSDEEEKPDPASDSDEAAGKPASIGPHMGRRKLANALALGTIMATSKKARSHMEDDVFNRNTWGDNGAPKWFVEEDKRFHTQKSPVSDDMLVKMRQRFLDVNSRPVKKIAEAKARKKAKLEKQVTKLRDQATKITDSSELSTSAKMQQLQKLYTSFGSHKKKAKSGKILVDFRTKKRIGGATRGKRVFVDKRMKKDKRGQMVALEVQQKVQRRRRAIFGPKQHKK